MLLILDVVEGHAGLRVEMVTKRKVLQIVQGNTLVLKKPSQLSGKSTCFHGIISEIIMTFFEFVTHLQALFTFFQRLLLASELPIVATMVNQVLNGA